MKTSTVTALLLLTIAVADGAEKRARELPSTLSAEKLASAHAEIEKLVIAQKTFENASLVDVVMFLAEFPGKMPGASPGTGINMVMGGGMEGSRVDTRISLVWKNIKWPDALDEFCQKTGLFWRITDHGIFVTPNKQ